MRVQVLSLAAAVFMFCLMAYVHIGLEVSFSVNLDASLARACGCSRCVGEFNEDQWFSERFKRSVPVLLNRRSYNLSGSTKRWWTNLHYRNGRSNRNYDLIKDSLFSVFPDKEYYKDSSHERCRTCAVVGNSANMNGSHYGPIIDAHDLVIRMNKGPTEGFEKDVGSRTTHRAIYPVSAMDMDNSTHLVLLPFSTKDLEWLKSAFTTKHINRTHTAVRSSIQANKDMVMILNPQFMQYVHSSWLQGKGKFPSTGFIMIVFSLHICDQVNVFGFGADQKGRWLHYFDTLLIKANAGNHRVGIEHNVLRELHMKKKITIFRGW